MQLNLKELETAIRNTIEELVNINVKDIYPAVGEVVYSDIIRNFDMLGRGNTVTLYDNTTLTWPDIKDTTKAQRYAGSRDSSGRFLEKPSWPPPRGYILQRTGDLRSSIFYENVGNHLRFGYSVDYGDYLFDRFNFLFVSRDALEDILDIATMFFQKKMK